MNRTDENKIFWLWLSLACGVGSKEFGRLVTQFEDAYELYAMNEEEIERLEGIGEKLKLRLCDKNVEPAENLFRLCREKGIEILPYASPRYPSSLKTLEDPPVLLYVLGELPPIDSHPAIGVVGTRKMSEYGRKTAFRLSYELAYAGAVIVSGMALGIDGVAASGALAARGKTVAVLGCGVLVDYPKAHRRLKEAIIKHRGAVISEYPPYEAAQPYYFPIRNRIVSGMTKGTLLVEGALKSGSMITARLAIGQGRQLFAVPGKVGEVNAEGPNALIREGAYVALTSRDILTHYEYLYREVLDLHTLEKLEKIPDCDEVLRYFGVPADYESGRFERRDAKKSTEKREKPKKVEPIETVEPKPTAAEAKPIEPSVPLSPTEQDVLSRMPLDRPISPDALCRDTCGIGEVLTALTMLELYGIVSSLPGGLYLRK